MREKYLRSMRRCRVSKLQDVIAACRRLRGGRAAAVLRSRFDVRLIVLLTAAAPSKNTITNQTLEKQLQDAEGKLE
jgi:hypothetical protein